MKNVFKNKKFRYGVSATVLTAIVIALVVIINITVSLVCEKFSLKIDLTKEQIFTLSDQTKDILSRLEDDVTITTLDTGNGNISEITEVINKYDVYSDKISVNTLNINKNPTYINRFVENGESVQGGSIVVECGEKYKLVSYYDIFEIGTDASGNSIITALDTEEVITSAINYVANGTNSVALFTTGHGEISGSGIESYLNGKYIETQTVNLLTADIDETADILYICAPKNDFTQDEINKIDKYIKNGGNVQVYFDVSLDVTPNIASYLDEWGIKADDGILVEQDSNHYYQTPLNILAETSTHGITSYLTSNNLPVLVMYSKPIQITNEVSGITVTPLLTTSENAFCRYDKESDSIVMDKTIGDKEGQFNLMVAAERSEGGSLIVAGSTSMLYEELLNESVFGASYIVDGVIKYFVSEGNVISIESKNVQQEVIYMTDKTANLLVILVLILIPLLIFTAGIVIWAKRRHL